MSIEVRGISKKFGTFAALNDVSLDVKKGELVALLGPSGSGKTTLLRIIAGLERADAGTVHFDGEDTSRQKTKDRGVGFVFQHYALFRHMTVFENVAFGLRVKPRASRPDAAQINARVHELLRLVQLDWVGDRYPSQLSGGQRQRIALARALAVEPRMLLLDEPFGSLDSKVRKELRQWLRRFHDELQITSLFVTHDQEEALEVADKIVVMNEGKIEQMGTPEDVYHNPVNAFVLNFLGHVNLFHGRVEDGQAVFGPPASAADGAAAARIYVRPHQLDIRREPGDGNAVRARVVAVNAAGPTVKVELVGDAGQFQAELPQEEYAALKLKVGEEVYVRPKKITFSEYSI